MRDCAYGAPSGWASRYEVRTRVWNGYAYFGVAD